MRISNNENVKHSDILTPLTVSANTDLTPFGKELPANSVIRRYCNLKEKQ